MKILMEQQNSYWNSGFKCHNISYRNRNQWCERNSGTFWCGYSIGEHELNGAKTKIIIVIKNRITHTQSLCRCFERKSTRPLQLKLPCVYQVDGKFRWITQNSMFKSLSLLCLSVSVSHLKWIYIGRVWMVCIGVSGSTERFLGVYTYMIFVLYVVVIRRINCFVRDVRIDLYIYYICKKLKLLLLWQLYTVLYYVVLGEL